MSMPWAVQYNDKDGYLDFVVKDGTTQLPIFASKTEAEHYMAEVIKFIDFTLTPEKVYKTSWLGKKKLEKIVPRVSHVMADNLKRIKSTIHIAPLNVRPVRVK